MGRLSAVERTTCPQSALAVARRHHSLSRLTLCVRHVPRFHYFSLPSLSLACNTAQVTLLQMQVGRPRYDASPTTELRGAAQRGVALRLRQGWPAPLRRVRGASSSEPHPSDLLRGLSATRRGAAAPQRWRRVCRAPPRCSAWRGPIFTSVAYIKGVRANCVTRVPYGMSGVWTIK